MDFKNRLNLALENNSDEDDSKCTRSYTINGPKYQVDQIEQLFSWISSCCSIGHSAEGTISVDGDGRGSLEIKCKDGDMATPEINEKYPEPEVSIGIN